MRENHETQQLCNDWNDSETTITFCTDREDSETIISSENAQEKSSEIQHNYGDNFVKKHNVEQGLIQELRRHVISGLSMMLKLGESCTKIGKHAIWLCTKFTCLIKCLQRVKKKLYVGITNLLNLKMRLKNCGKY